MYKGICFIIELDNTPRDPNFSYGCARFFPSYAWVDTDAHSYTKNTGNDLNCFFFIFCLIFELDFLGINSNAGRA